MRNKFIRCCCLLTCDSTGIAYAACQDQFFSPTFALLETHELLARPFCSDRYK